MGWFILAFGLAVSPAMSSGDVVAATAPERLARAVLESPIYAEGRSCTPWTLGALNGSSTVEDARSALIKAADDAGILDRA